MFLWRLRRDFLASRDGAHDPPYGSVLVVALAVVGPWLRLTRSLRMFKVSSRSGSMAGSLVPSSSPVKSESASGAASGETVGLFFDEAVFPGNMMSCRFGLSTVSRVRR